MATFTKTGLSIIHGLMKTMIALSVILVSCKEDESSLSSSNLINTKWTISQWDYSIGDDYIGLHDNMICYYFTSSNEGIAYLGSKNLYSDIGSSSKRCATYFKYHISNNRIELDFITDRHLACFDYLDFSKGKLKTLEGQTFSKSDLSSSDREWVNTHSGSIGNIKWYDNLAGGLSFIGNGNIPNYNKYDSTPWSKLVINEIYIKDGITGIGSYAFASKSIGRATIKSENMSYIGDHAFYGSSLGEILMPSSIATIGESAFADCKYLKTVLLPTHVETIRDHAFSGCNNTSISLYDTNDLREIGDYAFNGPKVTYFTESSKLKFIGAGAFSNISISTLTIKGWLNEICNNAFSGKFTNVYFEDMMPSRIVGTPFCPTTKTGSLHIIDYFPPDIDSDIIANYQNSWTLYVPQGRSSAYKSAFYWKNFKSIIEE